MLTRWVGGAPNARGTAAISQIRKEGMPPLFVAKDNSRRSGITLTNWIIYEERGMPSFPT